MRAFLWGRKMPLPNILEFIGTNITQRKFQEAQEKLLNYLGFEVPTKTELAVKADKTYVDNALTAIAGGHKAYATLAAALANTSTFPQNSIVEITNDGANNGTYQWNGADLTKSAYDPVMQAKADATTKANTAKAEAIANSTAKINDLKNASVISFDNSAFINTGYISNAVSGTISGGGILKYTDLIEVRKGDVIAISNLKTRNQFSAILYDTNQTFLHCAGQVTSDTYLSTAFKINVQQDGFIRVFNVNTNTGVSVVINRPNAVLYGVSDLSNKKSLSLKRFYNDEIFAELLKAGSSIFTQNQVYNYLTTGMTAQTGYAYYSASVSAGDVIKINARMDTGAVLAFFSDADVVKSQVIKTGDGTGTLSEVLYEVPSNGKVYVNTYIDALNDHALTFYKKEKPYGLGEDRALSHNDFMNNGKYGIEFFKSGFFINSSGAITSHALAFASKLFKIKAGQIVKLFQKSSGGLTTIIPITVFDLTGTKIANVTTSTSQSSGFYLSTYLATVDCYVQFSITNAYLATNSVDAYIEIPLRQNWDYRTRNLYVYGDSQAVLAGITADVSLRWANIIASNLGYALTNMSQAGRGVFRSTNASVPMLQLYNTTDYIKDYQNGDYLIIELWTNDANATPTVTVAEFKTAYRTILDYIIKDKKWPASNVKLVSGFWKATKTQALLDMEQAVKDLAAEYNIQSTNCTDYMSRQPDSSALIQSDGLHMTILGNAVVADWMYSVFNFGRS